VYYTLLDLATANDELEALQLSRADVEKWLLEWDINQDEKSAFLKNIVGAYQKAGQPYVSTLSTRFDRCSLSNRNPAREIAYEYSLSYVRSLPPNSSNAQDAAIDIIATALRLPLIFKFDPLFKIDAVVAAKDHELFSLLQIFVNDGLLEFKAWNESHHGTLEKYSMLLRLSWPFCLTVKTVCRSRGSTARAQNPSPQSCVLGFQACRT
jgi:translation initiation factor 3 subunit M